MKICAQREAERRKPPRRRFSSLLSPSHGPSRFVTSHSRFALAFVRKTKRLRRRQCLRHVSGKLPTYPFHVILFFFYSLLQDSVVKIQARRELDHLALLDHLDQLDCLDHQAPKAHNEIFYLINKMKISSKIKNKIFTNRNTVTPSPYPPLKKMKTKAKMCAKSTLLCIR